MVFSVCASILTINVVPILLGEDFGLMQAAKIAGLVGVGTILGRLTGGFFLDRYDGRFVALATCAAPMLGIGTLLASHNSTPAAMFACFTMGLSSGAEYDAVAYLAGRHLSIKHFGFLFGIIASLTEISSAVAPVISNAVYDITESYDRVLLGMVPTLAVAGLLFLALGPYPRHRDDAEPHPKQELA